MFANVQQFLANGIGAMVQPVASVGGLIAAKNAVAPSALAVRAVESAPPSAVVDARAARFNPEDYWQAKPFFDRMLPQLDGPRHELCYAERLGPARMMISSTLGEPNRFNGTLAIGANASAIALGHAHCAMHMGARAYLSEQLAYARSHDLLDVRDNRGVEIGRRHFLHGIDLYARAVGADIIFEGVEKIPEEGRIVVYIAANHDDIWLNNAWAWADPAAVPVADGNNFSFNRAARMSGTGFFFDLLGVPFISRVDGKGNNDRHARLSFTDPLSRRNIQLVLVHGIRPIIMIQEGRGRTCFYDDGTQAPSLLYANTPDPAHPEVYARTGGAMMMISRLAKEAGCPVTLGVLSFLGTEMVTSKHQAPSFPYCGRARSGQTVRLSLVDTIEIAPRQKGLGKIAKEAVGMIKRHHGVDSYLESVVAEWAREARKVSLGDAFAEAARRDERFFIIAAAITSIHPRHPERRHFKARLLNTLGTRGGASDDDVRRLLMGATRTAKRYEYGMRRR